MSFAMRLRTMFGCFRRPLIMRSKSQVLITRDLPANRQRSRQCGAVRSGRQDSSGPSPSVCPSKRPPAA